MKIKEAVFIKSAVDKSQYPKDSIGEVAFSGRSNVGKSSMINCLVGRRGLAWISSSPGQTRALNFYRVNQRWYFVDLPGYGYGQVSKELRREWKRMIEEYFENRSQLKLVVLIIDPRRKIADEEIEFLFWLKLRRIPYLLVATKIDKLTRSEKDKAIKAIRKEIEQFNIDLIEFSAKTQEGKDQLWDYLDKALLER